MARKQLCMMKNLLKLRFFTSYPCQTHSMAFLRLRVLMTHMLFFKKSLPLIGKRMHFAVNMLVNGINGFIGGIETMFHPFSILISLWDYCLNTISSSAATMRNFHSSHSSSCFLMVTREKPKRCSKD